MLGQKLKELREAKGFVQREVAAELHVDTAYISKIESNEKPLSRQHLARLAELFQVQENDLLAFWLADKVYDLLKGEPLAAQSLDLVVKAFEVEEKTKKKGQKPRD
jgi:HTH-type transcriptional regulator, competence development regulator